MSAEWLIGINPVAAALEHDPSQIIELVFESGSHNPRLKELVELAKSHGLRPQSQPREALDRMAEGERHQGVVARVKGAKALDEADLTKLIEAAGQAALVLILDGVTDPHNLGACLRSAEAAGATAVVIPKDRAVGITPIVRRASAGAADRVPLVRVTNLARAMKQLKDQGVWLTGLAGEDSQSFYAGDYRGPIGLVLGSEGEGMRRLTRENCDYLAQIPMLGSVESLNVSVAAGVALFEALRQRSASPQRK